MHAKVAVGLAGLVAGAYAATSDKCSSDITISSASDATINCDRVQGTITVNGTGLSQITIDGPKRIGALVVSDVTGLVSLTSSTISSIDGIFNLTELSTLSSLNFPSLRSVGEINWVSLDQLPEVTFGTEGVTKVSKVTISDTFINNLGGLNIASVDDISINNNRKLTLWTSDLANVTSTLVIQSNGGGEMVINMPKLTWANSMEIRNVKEFNAPLLAAVNQSMRFDENDQMTNFSAPNVTLVREIAFTNNNQITNITYPKLTETEGALTIQNNTALKVIDGFPKLETVKGTFILRGSFDNATFPSLKNVFGQGTITSTEDIDSSCEFFNTLHSNGDIQGDNYQCTSNNEKANEGGDGGRNTTSSDSQNAAGSIATNLAAVVGAAVLGAFALL